MADEEPVNPPATPEKFPVLDYPSPPAPAEPDSERWPEVFRAMLVVFGIMGTGAIIIFGFCGGLLRGCG